MCGSNNTNEFFLIARDLFLYTENLFLALLRL